MNTNERIFQAAFQSLEGQPAGPEAFRTITRACVRCAMQWVDLVARIAGAPTDEQLVAVIADIAREELAEMRATSDQIDFRVPPMH